MQIPIVTVQAISAGLSAAHEQAAQTDCRIVAVIVNPSGRTSGLLRHPEAFLASNEYAEWKAWTSASFHMSTSEFATMLSGAGEDVRQGLLAHSKATALPGGVPVIINDQLVCAVGVSGGDEAQDTSCANAGVEAIAALLNTRRS